MSAATPNWNAVLEQVRDVYERLPFNELLGLKVDHLERQRAGFRFAKREALVGNFIQGILHGGVISAVLDTTGGMMATVSALGRMLENGCSREEMAANFARIGTIDMRVDYLRPGRGDRFRSTATLMRAGRSVAVTRMELTNEADALIAVGTGAYKIG
ncbi:MAG: thioesterase family protein [Desulfosarcinaceae bacterium]|nr:thioesterase family protein [Desulfosarcinaceae bacterium]